MGLKHAAYKILVDANNQILGAHILSDHASGLINTIKQAMLNETTVDELYQQTIVSPYPTRESDLSYMLKPLLSRLKMRNIHARLIQLTKLEMDN